jgi:hypothetical protein
MLNPLQTNQLILTPLINMTTVNYKSNSDINNAILTSQDLLNNVYLKLNGVEKLRFFYYLLFTKGAPLRNFLSQIGANDIPMRELTFLIFVLRPYLTYINYVDTNTKNHVFVSLLSPYTLYLLLDCVGSINNIYRSQLWQQMSFQQQYYTMNMCSHLEVHTLFTDLTPQQQYAFIQNSFFQKLPLNVYGLFTNISLINQPLLLNIYLMIPPENTEAFMRSLNPTLQRLLNKYLITMWWKNLIISLQSGEDFGDFMIKELCTKDPLQSIYYPVNGVYCTDLIDPNIVLSSSWVTGDNLYKCAINFPSWTDSSPTTIMYSQNLKKCAKIEMCSYDKFIINNDIQLYAKYTLPTNYIGVINTYVLLPAEYQVDFINRMSETHICNMLFHIELSYVYTYFTKNQLLSILSVEEQLRFGMLDDYYLDLLMYNTSQVNSFVLQKQIYNNLTAIKKKAVMDKLQSYRSKTNTDGNNYVIIADNMFARLYWNDMTIIQKVVFIQTLTIESALNFYMKLMFVDKLLFFTLLPPYNGLSPYDRSSTDPAPLQTTQQFDQGDNYHGDDSALQAQIRLVFRTLRNNVSSPLYPPSYVVDSILPTGTPKPPAIAVASTGTSNESTIISNPTIMLQNPPNGPAPSGSYVIFSKSISQPAFATTLSIYEIKALLTFLPKDNCWKTDDGLLSDIVLKQMTDFQKCQSILEKCIKDSVGIFNDQIGPAIDYYQQKIAQIDATVNNAINIILQQDNSTFPKPSEEAIKKLKQLISSTCPCTTATCAPYVGHKINWCGTPENCAKIIQNKINESIFLAKQGKLTMADALLLPTTITNRIQNIHAYTDDVFGEVIGDIEGDVRRYNEQMQAAIAAAAEAKAKAEKAAYDQLPWYGKVFAWLTSDRTWKFIVNILLNVIVAAIGIGAAIFTLGTSVCLSATIIAAISLTTTIVTFSLSIATTVVNYNCGNETGWM